MSKEKKPEKEKKEKKELLVLLDAHAIIHRAYHALPQFATSAGEPTGALYGISSMLIRIIKDLNPDYIVACYDLPEKTFRHEAYEAYKGGRKKAEPELIAQIKKSGSIFESFSVPMYSIPGFEADDILGTIVHEMKGKDVDIIIASGDLDTFQLINDKKVQVYTFKKGINDYILYDEKMVVERFGFVPKLLPDYKGLRGDPSDNIIGIAGIGEKTASTLIQNFGTIEEMYKKLKKDRGVFLKIGITERIVKLLEENEEEALFSKTLAQIRSDAPIKFSLPLKKWREDLNLEKVEQLFKELEFKSLFARLEVMMDGENSAIRAIKEKEELSIIDQKKIDELLLALPLLDQRFIGATNKDILEFVDSKDRKESGEKLFRIAEKNIREEIKKKKLEYVYEQIELPIAPLVREMEQNGILIDNDYLKDLSVKYHKELKKLEDKIWGYAGKEFNVNSPKQLGEILFEVLKIPLNTKEWRIKRSAKGAISTNVSELEKLKDAHPIINEIMAYREIQKLLSTYIDVIPGLVAPDGRLHTSFIQIGAATGRFSSNNPNLQNIPTKTELGNNIRKSFIVDPGFTMVSFDYSQIELRIGALLSQDKNLIEIFNKGEDVHSAVAARIFGVQESEVTKEMRRQAKVVNFGLIYGMGINSLRKNLGVEKKEAEEFYQNYQEKFPEFMTYLSNIKNEVEKIGYTETLFGRRRYFPEIKSKIPFIKAMAERMALNAPFQGTAADFIKIAIKRADDGLIKNNLKKDARLILQVHDELLFEIKKEVLEKAIKIIKEDMEDVLPEEYKKGRKNVTFDIGVKMGENWGEMEEVG